MSINVTYIPTTVFWVETLSRVGGWHLYQRNMSHPSSGLKDFQS